MLRALILGIVQGLTEFLPISSSAHLSIVPKLLGLAQPKLAFDVLLHFGTLVAVIAYFWKDLWGFVLSLVAPARLGAAEARLRRRLLVLLIIASVPAAIAGLLLNNWADRQTSHPFRAAVFLVVTTVVLIVAELFARSQQDRTRGVARVATATRVAGDRARGIAAGRGPDTADAAGAASEAELERLPAGKAVGIGIAQCLALVPGVSRSGITISTGLFEGITRETAARFSFLLSIPAILGAGVLKLHDLSAKGGMSGLQLGIGFVAAAVSGFVAVSFLIRLLRTRTLWPFIWYRLVAGSIFVVLLATVRK